MNINKVFIENSVNEFVNDIINQIDNNNFAVINWEGKDIILYESEELISLLYSCINMEYYPKQVSAEVEGFIDNEAKIFEFVVNSE